MLLPACRRTVFNRVERAAGFVSDSSSLSIWREAALFWLVLMLLLVPEYRRVPLRRPPFLAVAVVLVTVPLVVRRATLVCSRVCHSFAGVPITYGWHATLCAHETTEPVPTLAARDPSDDSSEVRDAFSTRAAVSAPTDVSAV